MPLETVQDMLAEALYLVTTERAWMAVIPAAWGPKGTLTSARLPCPPPHTNKHMTPFLPF